MSGASLHFNVPDLLNRWNHSPKMEASATEELLSGKRGGVRGRIRLPRPSSPLVSKRRDANEVALQHIFPFFWAVVDTALLVGVSVDSPVAHAGTAGYFDRFPSRTGDYSWECT